MIISRSFLLRVKNVSGKSHGEIQNTHFVFSNSPPQIMPLWDNVEKYCSAGHATWQYGVCALHSGYIRLHKHTHTEYCFSAATVVTRTLLNVSYICTLPVFVTHLFSSSLFDVFIVVRRSVAAWGFELCVFSIPSLIRNFVVEGRSSKKLTF
jgi:hypothetical protein